MKNDEWLRKVAELTRLPFYQQQRLFESKGGALVGERDGYLVAIGLGKTDRKYALKLLVRYAKNDNRAGIQQALKAAKGGFGVVRAEADTALAIHSFSFGKPDPEKVAQDVQSLLSAVRSVAPPLGSACESCGRKEEQITLLNRVPGRYCAACQARIHQEMDAAAMEYDQRDENLPQGVLYAAVVALVCSVLWGLVAIVFHRIFAIGAIAIGVIVGWALTKGAGKVTWAGRTAVALLTLASILFGDALFYAEAVTKAVHLSFGVALRAVLQNFWRVELHSETGRFSIFFALVGAGVSFFGTRRPQFKAVFEPLGEASQGAAKSSAAV